MFGELEEKVERLEANLRKGLS
jgi:hypothetical protein